MTTNPERTPDTLRDKILTRIQRGELRMRPKSYFVLQAGVILALSVLVLLVSTFLANFISFTLRVGGHDSLLWFGPRGLASFLIVFPWGWLALDLALAVLAVLLVRRFRFGYRNPILSTAAALAIGALAIGIALDRGTPFNDDLLRSADNDALPSPLGEFYEMAHAGPPHDAGIFRGIVSAIGTSTITLVHDDFDHDRDDGAFVVIPPQGFDFNAVSVGDDLYIAGTPTPDGISAYGIRELPQDE